MSEIFQNQLNGINMMSPLSMNIFDPTKHNIKDYLYIVAIAPLITSVVNTLVGQATSIITIICVLLLRSVANVFNYFTRPFKFNKNGAKIFIPITKKINNGYATSSITVDESAIPILWYINKMCNNISIAKLIISDNPKMLGLNSMYSLSRFDGDPLSETPHKNVKSKDKQLLYLPMPTEVPTNSLFDSTNNQEKKMSENNLFSGLSNEGERSNIMKYSNITADDFLIEKDIYCQPLPLDGDGLAIIIKSKTKNMSELQEYIGNIVSNYKTYIESNNDYLNKVFVYSGSGLYKLYDMDKSQTFDNMFFSNKDKIMHDLKRLSNVEFYQNRGIKRKLSYLFVGGSGTGKSCCASAMANFSNRTIIYVPISRITSNTEIEQIIYSNTYNSYFIPNDKKIILFDELDSLIDTEALKKSINKDYDTPKKDSVEKTNIVILTNPSGNNDDQSVTKIANKPDNDKFNIGMFVSLLDGINDQDGMVIIATANRIDHFDECLYRDGRLKKVEFEQMGKMEIAMMIEKYCDVTLTGNQLDRIRDDKIIQNLTLKNVCIDLVENNKTIDQIIDKINELEKSVDLPKFNISRQQTAIKNKKYDSPINSYNLGEMINHIDKSKFGNIIGNLADELMQNKRTYNKLSKIDTFNDDASVESDVDICD